MGKIQNQVAQTKVQSVAPQAANVNLAMSAILDGQKMRKRFDELLGKRAPQFVSSLVSLVNATPELQKAMFESPMTVIQAGLKAATFDLPIDQNLGYAYIVPFNKNTKDQNGEWHSTAEAHFILGWKGMHQLALRTGAYKCINVTDVRDGELKSYNRLTEEIDLDFIEDDKERNRLPIIGYVGYYKLVNGAEKTLYMTKKQIESHEQKFRKGKNMGKGWRDDFDSMARKTVYRQLIGKWGMMSIDYQTQEVGLAIAGEMSTDINEKPENAVVDAVVESDNSTISVDESTGEVLPWDAKE